MSFILRESLMPGHGRLRELTGLLEAAAILRHELSLPKPADMPTDRFGQRLAIMELAAKLVEAKIEVAVQRMLAEYIDGAFELSQLQRHGVDRLILDRIAICQQKQDDDAPFTFGELKKWFKE